MIDAVKDYLAPKRFGVVAYVCLIVYFLCGLALTAVTSALRAGETGKFSCTVDSKSTAAYKTYVEKTCYSRYEQTYNSPLPLYGFVLLSIGITLLVSIVYSLGVSTRVDEVDQVTNDDVVSLRTEGEETRYGFYVFYFYVIHLFIRSLISVLFTVLQHTVFYPGGFHFEYSCILPKTDTGKNVSVSTSNNTFTLCENSTASEKQLWSTIVSSLNIVLALITYGEVMYLICRRFSIFICRFDNSWSDDREFVTTYLLRKRYVRVDNELPDLENSFTRRVDFYKQQVMNSPRAPDICYGQKGNLDEIYVDVIIHTGRAQHKFQKEMDRHEIFDVYMKVPESSIRINKIAKLFYPRDDTKDKFPRTILAVGRPGIGKTIFSEKILRDWASGVDAFYLGKVIFFYKFRWFNVIDDYRNLPLKTFLQYGTGLSKEEFEGIFEEILRAPHKAIFIFDGLDEFDGDLITCTEHLRGIPNDPNLTISAMSLFIKLANKNLLPGATVLVTSRSTADHLYSELDFDRSVEILGFTSDKIEEYVSRFCDNNERRDLQPKIWNHVKSSSDLLNLCYIPVNCFIICVTLSGCLFDPNNDNGALPTTLTELYNTAIDHFTEKRNRKCDEASSEQTLKNLQKLAFEGMKNGQLVFDKRGFYEEMKNSGLINSLSNPIFPVQTQYCFIHLTIQEFLAAKHVTETLSPKEIEDFIETHIKSGSWHLVLQFIAGLLSEKIKMPGSDYLGCGAAFTKGLTVKDGTVDLGTYGNMYVIRCLGEVGCEKFVKEVCCETSFNTVTSILGNSGETKPSPSDWASVASVCKHLKNMKDIKLSDTFIHKNCWMEIVNLLKQICLERLEITAYISSEKSVQEKLIIALIESKCTLEHEHTCLRDLVINFSTMTPECVSRMCEFIEKGNARHLTHFNLRNSHIDASGISQLCQVLNGTNCKELTSLHLGLNEMGDEGVRALCDVLKREQNVKELNLDNCSLTKDCMADLSETLCDEHCKLNNLILVRNNIGDEGLRTLCERALRTKHCKLTKLDVDSCNLTGGCIPFLCETLEDANCKLVKLKISIWEKVTEKTKEMLRKVVNTETCGARHLEIEVKHHFEWLMKV